MRLSVKPALVQLAGEDLEHKAKGGGGKEGMRSAQG